MQEVKVEIISDYICPWCYLGKVRLEKLQAKLKTKVTVILHIKPYLLYPHIPAVGSPKTDFATKTKPGMGRSLRAEAKNEEIEINYNLIDKIPSSREAHRFTWLIKDVDKKYLFAKSIFCDYFEKGQDIGDKKYLLDLASIQKIDASIIQSFEMSDAGEKEVIQSIQQSKEEFISVVPSIILNDQFLIPGLQSMEVWENYILRAAKKKLL